MKTLISSIAILIIYALLTSASGPIVITGKVTDDQGTPLAGVNVIVKKFSNNTFTDINGTYRISVRTEDRTLVFSLAGYVTKEVSINGRTIINVKLSQAVVILKELKISEDAAYSKAERSMAPVCSYSSGAVGGVNTSYNV